MRIATWNLQRPRRSKSHRVAMQRSTMQLIDADVWILTETHVDVAPGKEYRGAFTEPNPSRFFSAGERRTAIWSRLPIRRQVSTCDSSGAVCVEIESPAGPMLVYGTVLPYHAAGTRYPYWSQGKEVSGTRSWQLHYEGITSNGADWVRLRQQFPEHSFCVGGDFNQSRDGRRWGSSQREWYGTTRGRQLLTETLLTANLTCLTEEDFVASGKLQSKSSVEHLCVCERLSARLHAVHAREADPLDGSSESKRISDHNVVFIDFADHSS